jgi:hypothetical protein
VYDHYPINNPPTHQYAASYTGVVGWLWAYQSTNPNGIEPVSLCLATFANPPYGLRLRKKGFVGWVGGRNDVFDLCTIITLSTTRQPTNMQPVTLGWWVGCGFNHGLNHIGMAAVAP